MEVPSQVHDHRGELPSYIVSYYHDVAAEFP